MRRSRFLTAAAAATLIVGTAVVAQQGRGGGRGGRFGGAVEIAPGEECPPGTTEVRPRLCQKPEVPPPSIVDYRPKPTVVAPEHPVPRARFPVIDSHSHLRIVPE